MKNWQYSQKKALEKALYRSIHQCRCNPDYRLKYVAEAKANPTLKVLLSPNVEARKRIEHEYALRVKMVTPPPVARPARLNRV